jgi:hypothetical protein
VVVEHRIEVSSLREMITPTEGLLGPDPAAGSGDRAITSAACFATESDATPRALGYVE